MARKVGRPSLYGENTIAVQIRCDLGLHDLMQSFKVPDSEVWKQGATHIARLKSSDLNEQHITALIQAHRQEIQTQQDEIMMLERLLLDAKVREQARKKTKTETRYDERGREYIVVEAP